MSYSTKEDVQVKDVQPIFVGPYVAYRGRLMLRVCGAETPPAAGAGEGEGQGAGEGSSGLYDLSAAPEELRPFIEDELKKIEGNTTRKFQEHAEYRKQWEPYEQLGITDIPPEELQNLLQFAQLAQDQDAFQQWWEGVGNELGWLEETEGESEGQGSGEEGENMVEQVAAQVLETLDQRLQPFEQSFNQQQEQQRVSQAADEIRQELADLHEQHGEFNEDHVLQLAAAYEGTEDAISRAFEDYQQIVGGAERGVVQSRTGKPPTPVQGGNGAAQAEPIKTFEDANKAAAERFRQAAGA